MVTTFAFDTYGRMRSTTRESGGVSHVIERRYDVQGRLAYLFYPTTGSSSRFTVGYRYAYGQLLAVDDGPS